MHRRYNSDLEVCRGVQFGFLGYASTKRLRTPALSHFTHFNSGKDMSKARSYITHTTVVDGFFVHVFKGKNSQQSSAGNAVQFMDARTEVWSSYAPDDGKSVKVFKPVTKAENIKAENIKTDIWKILRLTYGKY
jgi:hypothetical protein